MRLLLDNAYVQALCQSSTDVAFVAWLRELREQDPRLDLMIPEIIDYEVRRVFLWKIRAHKKNKDKSNLERVKKFLDRLDLLPRTQVRTLPTTKEILDRAAGLWGLARSDGYSTAPEDRIDVDVIVASHALAEDAEIATKDVRDYERYGVKIAEIA